MQTKIRVVNILLLLMFLPANSTSQEFQFEKLSQILPHSIYTSLAIRDTLLFAGGDDLGMFDISDPTDPVLLSVTPVGHCNWGDFCKVKQILPHDDFLYLLLESHHGNWPDSIGIVDITDIYNPEIIYRDDMPTGNRHILDMAIMDTILAVAYGFNYNDHLAIFDISEIYPNMLECIIDNDLGNGVEASNDYIFYQHHSTQYTYSWNGNALEQLASLENVFWTGNMYSADDQQYLNGYIYRAKSNGNPNIQITNVLDPLNPFISGESWCNGNIANFRTVNDGILIRASSMMYLNDVSDPTSPVFIDTLDLYKESFVFSAVCIEDSILYSLHIKDDNHHLHIFDLSDPYMPEELAHLFRSKTLDIHQLEDHYMLVAQYNGLFLLDISDANNLYIVWEMLHDKYISQVEVSGDYVFVYGSEGYWEDNYLEIYNISNLFNPQLINNQMIPNVVDDAKKMIIVNDSTLYILLEENLYILDISDPVNISFVNAIAISCLEAEHMIIEDDLALIWGDCIEPRYDGEINIYSLVLPQSPQYLSSYFFDDGTGALQSGTVNDQTFIVSQGGNMQLLDISDPQNIRLLGGSATPSQSYALYVDDNILYWGAINMQLYAFNISDLAHITILDSFVTGGSGAEIIVDSNLVYYANSSGGLFIFDNSLYPTAIKDVMNGPDYIVQNAILYPPSPNPFNPTTELTYTIPASGEVSLTIYDIQGREVDVLLGGYQSSGEHSIVWDAKNLPSGIYFARLSSTNGQTQTRKLVLMK